MKIVILITFLLQICLNYTKTSAQDTIANCIDTNKVRVIQWANLGMGGAASTDLNDVNFINFGLSYHWQTKNLTYVAGASHSSKLLSGPEINNINAGIGKSIVKRFYIASITAGPGLIWSRSINTNVSINGQAEAAFTPIKNLGFGIELFTNLNKETNLFGFRIVIHLNDKKY